MKKILVLVTILIISNLSYSQNNDVIIDKIYSESIEKLSTNSKIKKAFKYIIDIEEKTMKNLIELTEIEAPPFKEEKRAKEFAERLKLAGIENQNFSGHSLRSWFATVAAESGADERSIMTMTGHKTTQMVRRYIREANIFKNNALNKIKL